MKDFENKNALVTGIGSGIGLETARRLAEGGARIVGVDRNEKRLQEAIASLARHAKPHIGITKDLRSSSAARSVVPDAIKNVEYLDIVVNAAGVCYFTRMSEIEGSFSSASSGPSPNSSLSTSSTRLSRSA